MSCGVPLSICECEYLKAERDTYNLKFHSLAIEFDCSDFLPAVVSLMSRDSHPTSEMRGPYKVNANSRNVAFSICVIRKSQQQAGLSDSGIPDQEELEQIVVSAFESISARLPTSNPLAKNFLETLYLLYEERTLYGCQPSLFPFFHGLRTTLDS